MHLSVDNRSRSDARTLRILNDPDGSSSPTRPSCVFSQERRAGSALGADRATSDRLRPRCMGEVLGRIDADTVLEPTWVHEVRAAVHAIRRVGAATGPMIYYDMPLRRFGRSRRRHAAPRHPEARPRVPLRVRQQHGGPGERVARHPAGSCAGTRPTSSTRTSTSASICSSAGIASIYGAEDGGRDVGPAHRRQPARVPELRLALPAHVRRARHRQPARCVRRWSCGRALYPALKGMRWQQLRKAASS